ncbi:MAG: AraC family transcriptional regulator [Bacteroidota bacterium]|jgi:AraC-like DNA-binding protein
MSATETYPKVYLYRRIVQAKLYIDINYASSIDVENIADEAFFSKFHFIRLFKIIYGKTPHQYLTAVRIEKAKQLLKNNTPVLDVCYSVGFESVSSFTGLFKRLAGITPSAYIFQQQNLKVQISQSPLTFVPACFAEKNGWLKE